MGTIEFAVSYVSKLKLWKNALPS